MEDLFQSFWLHIKFLRLILSLIFKTHPIYPIIFFISNFQIIKSSTTESIKLFLLTKLLTVRGCDLSVLLELILQFGLVTDQRVVEIL